MLGDINQIKSYFDQLISVYQSAFIQLDLVSRSVAQSSYIGYSSRIASSLKNDNHLRVVRSVRVASSQKVLERSNGNGVIIPLVEQSNKL